MKFEKINNKGQAQLFKNQYLEMLTKTHPLVIWGMYVPVISYFLYYAGSSLGYPLARIALTFLGGMFFWTFFEYIMHRFVFHFHAENENVKKVVYTAHGVHHEYPRDKDRLFMPPVPSLVFATVLFSIFFFLLKNNAFMFFPGFLTGYLIYGSMHYAIHAMAPPFKFMKAWWRYHHLHHYKDDGKGFGVSSPLWDHVFSTVPPHDGKFQNPEER